MSENFDAVDIEIGGREPTPEQWARVLRPRPYVYLACSHSRSDQHDILAENLRANGVAHYDPRLPEPGMGGFSWSHADPDWSRWSEDRFVDLLKHDRVIRSAFERDMRALRACTHLVCTWPCGFSAGWETGWATANGRKVIILVDGNQRDLMVADAILCTTVADVLGEVLR
jgi:hypothetical protein